MPLRSGAGGRGRRAEIGEAQLTRGVLQFPEGPIS